MILKYIQLSKLKTPLGKMAGIALKGQCDLDSIMVPPSVPHGGFLARGIFLKNTFGWGVSFKGRLLEGGGLFKDLR